MVFCITLPRDFCTSNDILNRRSEQGGHLGDLWEAIFAKYYGLGSIKPPKLKL